jgi:hypothetical protein
MKTKNPPKHGRDAAAAEFTDFHNLYSRKKI